MKSRTITVTLSEGDVRPSGHYEAFRNASFEYGSALLKKSDAFESIVCPGCKHNETAKTAFTQRGYTYWHCNTCASLYMSPRPSTKQHHDYLFQSDVSRIRTGESYFIAIRAQLEKLYQSRLDHIQNQLFRHAGGSQVADLHTRYPLYAELTQKEGLELHLIDPLFESAAHVATVGSSETLKKQNFDLFSAFDVLEHIQNPSAQVKMIYESLKPGGLFIGTTRSGSGFDIQNLWEHTELIPLEHLNLPSVEGMQALLENNGFEVIELSTPGQLDVAFIERYLQENPDVMLPRFTRYFFEHRDKWAKERLQTFIQENLLSSHLSFTAKRKA